jgi:hypothetical protein
MSYPSKNFCTPETAAGTRTTATATSKKQGYSVEYCKKRKKKQEK